ncbi:MAG TPA: glycosyltransferase family 2 protein [Anaerolineae bacterium]|nr:glycosyltransferase family 2 protein [Anaerolineae bacterium]HQJ50450.1 glycosyltransferase family 2 protein [Anaerolineae bacterium]
MDLSIIIVNYNTCDLLRDCLRSVLASQVELSYEILVVDNKSPDDSVAMVRSEYPQARLIESPVNGGYAYANNLGLRAASGAHLLLLNPDTVLPPRALQDMYDFVVSHPEVGVAGPKLVRADGSLDLACRRSFPTLEVAFYRLIGLSRRYPHSPRFNRYNLCYLDPDEMTEVDAVVGAFMWIRREALEQAGLLDERFFAFGEDIDLCYRIKVEQGWKVYYNPQVVVTHYKSQAMRKDALRMNIQFYRAMWLFHEKHYASKTFFLLNWLTALGTVGLCATALVVNLLRPPAKRKVGL